MMVLEKSTRLTKRLYKISQTVNNGYDTYGSAVVVSFSEVEASVIHPRSNAPRAISLDSFWDKNPEWREWANTPREVVVEYLGDLSKDSHYKLNDVVIANYRAG